MKGTEAGKSGTEALSLAEQSTTEYVFERHMRNPRVPFLGLNGRIDKNLAVLSCNMSTCRKESGNACTTAHFRIYMKMIKMGHFPIKDAESRFSCDEMPEQPYR